MEKIREVGKYDIVVVGGGIAGVSASIASARKGMKVCLIEKFCALGGLATLGNVCVYLPLCDGKGNQVIGGIAEELLKLSVSDGYRDIPQAWKEGGNIEERKKIRYKVEFNPVSFMLLLEELVLKEGIEIRYDSRVFDVIKEDDRIKEILILDKEGIGKISCKVIIDATGDADICFFAGEKVVSVDKNVACGWFFYYDGKDIKKYPFTLRFDSYNIKIEQGIKTFSGDKADDITNQVIESRKYILKKFFEIKEKKPSSYLLLVPTIPTFRMTRRLKGKTELKEEDEGKIFPDSVGMTGDWRKPGLVYHIPFSCLYAVKIKNLITAGRCISASTAWDVVRTIPVCALTGEISGTASALYVKEMADSFSSLDIKKLKKTLKNHGVIIDERNC